MKLRKNISRFLTFGIMLNNIYFCSNASNTEIPSRYETLKGEYITIDDSLEGELHEIEIFGNTVQDSDNLGNIQSVGDLYVDKEGNPILDSQGRKQYKIEIESESKNILPEDLKVYRVKTIGNDVYNGVVIENENTLLKKDEDGYYIGVDTGWVEVCVTQKIEISPNITYSFFAISKQKNRCYNRAILFYDNEGNFIKRLWDGESIEKKEIKPPDNAKFMRVQISCQNTNSNNHNIKLFMLRGAMPNNYSSDLWENHQDWMIDNGFCVEPQSHKTTILLPAELRKIGDVADKLYWDKLKHRYVIQRSVGIYTTEEFKASKIVYDSSVDMFNLYASGIIKKNWPYNYKIKTTIGDFSYHDIQAIQIPATYFEEFKFDTEGLYNYLKEIEFKAYYVLIGDQRVEVDTSVDSKIKILMYNNTTHIFMNTKNNVNPTLKVTIDRLPQMARDGVKDAKVNSTSSNISLARMYVNLLSESLYKDQLQEQLNQLFSSDMVLERQSVSANLDVYIKSENMLSMSLDTNNITFEEYSGVEELELQDAINISINSSLPYSLNAYVVGDITNSDNSKTMDLDVLNIKDNSEVDYQKFDAINNKIRLKDSCNKGNNLNHTIDLKLSSSNAHKADIYKTTIKFEAEQK